MVGGDIIKVTQQLQDLMKKALKNDLKNPRQEQTIELNEVS